MNVGAAARHPSRSRGRDLYSKLVGVGAETRSCGDGISKDPRGWSATFAPDAGWITYVSDESGRREVYVTKFPSGEGKWQIPL